MKVDLTDPTHRRRDRDRAEMRAAGVSVEPLDATTHPKLVELIAHEAPGRMTVIEARYDAKVPG